MAASSSIGWTNATWNPVRGCTKISPGCKHCYAETFAEQSGAYRAIRMKHGFDLKLVPHKLGEPLKWTTPKMIFVNSMSDLFQAGIPERFHRTGRTRHADGRLAYLSGADQAQEHMGWDMLNGPLALAAAWAESCLVGRQRGGGDRRYGVPRIDALRNTPGSRAIPLGRAVPSRIWARSI